MIALTLAWVFSERLYVLDLEITKASGILAVVLVIGGVYVVGLSIFSAMWWLFRKGKRSGPEEIRTVGETGWPSFPLLFEDHYQAELILYFWYLRATCFGIAVAFGLSAVIILSHALLQWISPASEPPDSRMVVAYVCTALVELLAARMLILQGQRFNKGVDRALAPRALEVKAKGTSGHGADP